MKDSAIAKNPKECPTPQTVTKRKGSDHEAYRIYEPFRFLAFIVFVASWVSYCMGTAARSNLASKSRDDAFLDGTCNATMPSSWIKKGVCSPKNDERSHDNNGAPISSHLLLDIQGVNRGFLSSEHRMQEALFHIVEKYARFDLLCTYFQLTKAGNVIIGGVSDDNQHAWLYGWPTHGVVFVDIFSASDFIDVLQIVPAIEALFASMSESENSVHWVQKPRGFYDHLDEADIHAQADLQWFPIGTMVEYKKEVASVQTPFQLISVWDVMESSTVDEKSIPHRQELDRIVFLDGLLQSRRTGDAAYHEALVHPALFAHPNPRRVAIIGGGEGATLREVLKHNTVKEVVMIEIDIQMVNVSREFLPEWNDCSFLQGSEANCFDDRRTSLFNGDAFQWFKEHFLNLPVNPDHLFDVIIMDALDPQGAQEIVEALYTDEAFYESLYNGLTSDGILIAQVGQASTLDDPYYSFSSDRHFESFLKGLQRLQFAKITEYEEANCGFYDPWSFILASKQEKALTQYFYHNEALVNLKIRQRITPRQDGLTPLLYFDGATMIKYINPSKAAEEMFCRNPNYPVSCQIRRGPCAEIINASLSWRLSGEDAVEESVCWLKLEDPEDVTSSILLDSTTEKLILQISHICGKLPCRIVNLLSIAGEFGRTGSSGIFIVTHTGSACSAANSHGAPQNVLQGEAADMVLHRHALSLCSTLG